MALVLAFASPPVAGAELVQKGNLFVRFDGGIAPQALPRDRLASVAVRIEGTIRTPNREDPPAVRRIEVALNRGGRLTTRGLPICHRRQIELVSSSKALAGCGAALVGGGGFTAKTNFPDQANEVFPGDILLFNSVIDGRAATLAHVYQEEPAPITRIIVFRIRRTAGTFGTVITGSLPVSLNRNGYLKTIFLQMQRRYVFGGRQMAYLSASCPAPRGFASAFFPFARASMTFSDGRTLRATMTRTCRVR